MIKTIEVYTVICDGCGKDSNKDAEYAGWSDEGFTVDCAKEDNWIEDENDSDKHYCPDCYSYENDTLTIKSKP